jgi:PPK2 family polyphosphate:nucleotide phosphotransferase
MAILKPDRFIVKPGSCIYLRDVSTDWKPDISKKEGQEAVTTLLEELQELQNLLYAEHRQKLLVILQGMDGSGKDSTTNDVFGSMNVQGLRVANFKRPTLEELAHDYLWRVEAQTPATGEIVIFNRSHYEDVGIVKVFNPLIPDGFWDERYEDINMLERRISKPILVSPGTSMPGTTILKYFLHISKEHQAEEFEERRTDPRKHWKYNPEDLKMTEKWDHFMYAYSNAISATSTPYASWRIIPADHKWARNLIIATDVRDTLKDMKMQYPPLKE